MTTLFSAKTPKLQLAVDATSLAAFQKCPRYYQYAILEGYRGDNIDLAFGILAHKAMEAYNRALLAGHSWEDAQLAAVRDATLRSWDEKRDAPWGGQYTDMWRCLGETKYKNEKGNAAKCPYSHKGVWHEAPGPEICGQCGSHTETVSRWLPFDKVKERYNLLRFVAWFCEEDKGSLWRPVKRPDTGADAVEMNFRMPLPVWTEDGEQYTACGYLDVVKRFGDEIEEDAEYFVCDTKSTRQYLTKRYYQGFSPNVQMDLYDVVADFLFHDLRIKGVFVEAAQLVTEGVRFGKHRTHRTDAQRSEFLQDLAYWLKQMEQCAKAEHWPMNRAACYSCGFKEICARPAGERDHLLKAAYQKQPWNPLEER